jgi:hypothetical protein
VLACVLADHVCCIGPRSPRQSDNQTIRQCLFLAMGRRQAARRLVAGPWGLGCAQFLVREFRCGDVLSDSHTLGADAVDPTARLPGSSSLRTSLPEATRTGFWLCCCALQSARCAAAIGAEQPIVRLFFFSSALARRGRCTRQN